MSGFAQTAPPPPSEGFVFSGVPHICRDCGVHLGCIAALLLDG